MQISYDEFKVFCYDLNRFIHERDSETLKARTTRYIENNVTVNVPDEIYTAVRNYKENYTGLINTLNILTEPKKRRKNAT